MAFKKPVTIYESVTVKVYIHQCHNKGKKTRLFLVRRNDTHGLAHILGEIRWNGGWWQYVFIPATDSWDGSTTVWSKGCLEGITKFLDKINKEERAKWRR